MGRKRLGQRREIELLWSELAVRNERRLEKVEGMLEKVKVEGTLEKHDTSSLQEARRTLLEVKARIKRRE